MWQIEKNEETWAKKKERVKWRNDGKTVNIKKGWNEDRLMTAKRKIKVERKRKKTERIVGMTTRRKTFRNHKRLLLKNEHGNIENENLFL